MRAAFVPWRFITCSLQMTTRKKTLKRHTRRDKDVHALQKKNKKNHRNPNKFDGFIVLLIEQKNYDWKRHNGRSIDPWEWLEKNKNNKTKKRMWRGKTCGQKSNHIYIYSSIIFRSFTLTVNKYTFYSKYQIFFLLIFFSFCSFKFTITLPYCCGQVCRREAFMGSLKMRNDKR